MTKLAEGLARTYRVHVICGFPYYTRKDQDIPRSEERNRVRIERCRPQVLTRDIFL